MGVERRRLVTLEVRCEHHFTLAKNKVKDYTVTGNFSKTPNTCVHCGILLSRLNILLSPITLTVFVGM